MSQERQHRRFLATSLVFMLLLATAWTAITHSQEGKRRAEPNRDELPEGAVARLGLVNDARSVDIVAYSPDGKTLVSAHQDRFLCIWDTATNKLIRRFRGPEQTVTGLVFAADGKEFLTASKDDCAAVWEVDSARKVQALQLPGQRLLHVAYSESGQPLAWLTDEQHVIRQYSVASGAEERQFRGHSERVHAVALSPQGQMLASASQDKSVRLWDLASGKEITKVKAGQERHGRRNQLFGEPIVSLKFAPNGWTLFGGTAVHVYFLWDTESGEMLMASNYSLADQYQAMAFRPDSRLLLYALDGSLDEENKGHREGNALGGFEVSGTVIYRNQELVTSLAFSPDGQRLASGIADGTVMIWDAAARWSRENPSSQPATMADEHFEFWWTELGNANSGKNFEARWNFALARTSADFLRKKIRPVRNQPIEQVRKLINDLDDDVAAVRAGAYTRLEQLGTSIEDELKKTRARRPAPEVKLRVDMLLEACDATRIRRGIQVLEQMHSPASRQFLKELATGEPAAWQTRDAQAALKRLAKRPEPPPGPGADEDVAPEVKVEVSATPIKLLEKAPPTASPQPGFDALGDPLPAGAVVRIGSGRMRHRGTAGSLSFSRDGKSVISAGSDNLVRFWDPATGKEQRQFSVSSGAQLMVLAADGKTIFTRAGGDATIVCWDPATGRELGRFAPEIKESHALRQYAIREDGIAIEELQGSLEASSFQVAPDLRLVLSHGTVWEPATGKPWRHQPKDWERVVAFGPEGKTVIVDHSDPSLALRGKGLYLHDLQTGAEIRRLTEPGREYCGCARDGKRFVAWNADSLIVVNMANGKVVREVAIKNSSRPAAPPAGMRDFEPGDGGDAGAQRLLRPFALSADGQQFAFILRDAQELHLLDLATGGYRKVSLGRQDNTVALAYSPDGGLLAMACADGRVRLWNVGSGQPRFDFPRYFARLEHNFPQQTGNVERIRSSQQRLSPDGKTLAGFESDGRIGLWDTASGNLIGRLGGANLQMDEMIWSPQSSKILALRAQSPETLLWNVADGHLLWSSNPGDDELVGFSADEKLFATTVQDMARVFETASGKEKRRFKTVVPITAAAFSPDGKCVATTGADLKLRIWDVALGKETNSFEPHHGHLVGALCFSPDGKLLATIGDDGFIAFWDTATFKLLRRFPAPVHTNRFLAFSPDGKLLTARDADGNCGIWDSTSGKLERRIAAQGPVLFAAFMPDSRRAVTGGADGTALVWDLARLPAAQAPTAFPPTPVAAEANKPLPPGVLARMGEPGLRADAWLSSDGRTLIGREGDGFQFLDLASGKEVRRFESLSPGTSNLARLAVPGYTSYYTPRLAIDERRLLLEILNSGTQPPSSQRVGGQTDKLELSPDGKLLVGWGWSNNSIAIWDAVTGQKINQFIGHVEGNNALVFSADSKLIATAGSNNSGASKDFAVRVWDAPTGRLRQTLRGHKSSVMQIAFSPDGNRLLACSGNDNGPVLGQDQVVGWVDAGGLGAARNPMLDILLWDLASGKLIRHLRIPGQWTQVSPDGRTIAYHTGENLFVWDVVAEQFLPRPQVKKGYSTCVFSGDGKILATVGGEDDPIRWWDVASGKELGSLDERGVQLVGFGHDGKTLVVTKANTTRFWDLTTRREIRPAAGHREAITALAFAPDKSLLVSGSADKTVRLWDVKSGKERRRLTGHKEPITHVTFAPDGRKIASADQSQTILIWDAVTGRETLRIPGAPQAPPPNLPNPPPGVAFIPDPVPEVEVLGSIVFTTDSKTLLAMYRTGAVWQWDLATGKQTRVLQGMPEATAARGGSGFACCLSPQGQLLADATMKQMQISEFEAKMLGVIRIREVQSGKVLRTIVVPDERCDELAFSADGKLLLGQALGMAAPQWNSRHLIQQEGGTVRIWEVESGQEVRSGPMASACLGFSPRGDAVLSRKDQSNLAFWDLASGQGRARPTGLDGPIMALAHSADGRCLALAGSDRTMVVLDAAALEMARQPWPAPAVARSLDELWQNLAGDAASAWEAIHFLTLEPQKAGPLLAGRLKPSPTVEPERLQKLLANLDHPQSSVRQAAEGGLEALEEAAEPGLKKHLQNPALSLDARSRVERLLARLENAPSTEQLRCQRALTVLERIGTPEARAVLQTLAGGASASRLTRAARECLERLER